MDEGVYGVGREEIFHDRVCVEGGEGGEIGKGGGGGEFGDGGDECDTGSLS